MSLTTIPAIAAIEDLQCVGDALGNPSGNFCTANDVRITEFTDVEGPDTCTPGEEYTVIVTAEVESGPGRYDLGLWFDQSGTGAKTPGALCTREILSPTAGSPATCDPFDSSGNGPFFSADGDACGDTSTTLEQCAGRFTRPCSEGGGTCNVVLRKVEVTTICVDIDDDGVADISSCTSWKQNTSDDQVCSSPNDVVPGTTSKCSCDYVSTKEIFTGCRSDADCTDELFCNGAETCDTGTGECVAGTSVDCSGLDDQCNAGVCDEATDACVADYSGTQGQSCNDGLFCNVGEVCIDGACGGGSPNACGDGVSCTNDSCNEDTDSCVNTPDDSNCSDQAYCNGDETCDATNGCQAGTAPDCSDGVSCTNDACNEDTDSCDNTPDDSLCDNGQFCDGDETCDAVDDCLPGTPMDVGDEVVCTLDECDEVNDEIVHTPFDGACDDGNVCNGDEVCDTVEGCVPGENLPEGEACGDQTTTVCTEPDTCDGEGECLNNNLVCGALTDSALCEFDVEPDKGVCVGGDDDGDPCSLSDGGACPDGACEQSKEFRLGFNVDGKNKHAYRPPSSNPGQFYYNAIYDGTTSEGDGEIIAIVVPWPFITHGATPLHVYDGNEVGTLETCFMPGEALMQEKYLITLEDWNQPGGYVAPDYLTCDEVDGIGESGDCTLAVFIPQEVIDVVPNGLLYINLHMDYGLKGNWTDGLPPFGLPDRYDPGASVSPWGSRDALQDTNPGNGPVAIGDCTDYNFSHWDEDGLLFEDSGVNLNIFKINGNGP